MPSTDVDPAMLKALFTRSITGVIATVALAVAAGLCVVAAGYGLYALLRLSLSPAAAAGLTAVAAAILVALLAVFLTRLSPAKAETPQTRRQLDPEMVRQVVGVGAILASLVADATVRRRLDHKPDKHRRSSGKKRR